MPHFIDNDVHALTTSNLPPTTRQMIAANKARQQQVEAQAWVVTNPWTVRNAHAVIALIRCELELRTAKLHMAELLEQQAELEQEIDETDAAWLAIHQARRDERAHREGARTRAA
jgi:ribosome-binding ATPase YchF (GTP1/OBG family)